MTPSLTTADVQVLVGSFYATRENLLIPILDALHIVAMKVNGVDLSVIETEILIQRRIAAAAPERTAQR